MSSSSVILGIAGILLNFFPEILLRPLQIPESDAALLVVQILGALYFAFAAVNWMSRSNLIGGIYNRSLAVANLLHFMIAGFALIRAVLSIPNPANVMWIAMGVYLVFAILFGLLLFRHPSVPSVK